MKRVVNFMTVFLIENILCSRKGKENLSDERPSDKDEKEDYQSRDKGENSPSFCLKKQVVRDL